MSPSFITWKKIKEEKFVELQLLFGTGAWSHSGSRSHLAQDLSFPAPDS